MTQTQRWISAAIVVLAVSLALAQDKTSSTSGDKAAAGGKTADTKTGDTKTADAKPEPKVHEKTAAFRNVYEAFRDTIKRLGDIQIRYREVRPDGRAALVKDFDDQKAKAKSLLTQLTAAAEAAIVVDPSDAEVIDYLGALADQAERRGSYEKALEVARLVLDKQPTALPFRRPELYRIGGLSAYYIGQFDVAERYLNELKKPIYLSQDQLSVSIFRGLLAQERELWAKEIERQKAEAKPDGDPLLLPRVLLETSQGNIELELFENEAPNTVANFITLVERKFYDGKRFDRLSKTDHRIGEPIPSDQDVAYKIPSENDGKTFRRLFRGSVKMYEPGGKDSASTEFELRLEPIQRLTPDANGGDFTVFGRVVAGFEVLSELRDAGEKDRETRDQQMIKTAKVIRKRPHPYAVRKVGDKPKAEVSPSDGKSPAKTAEATTPAKSAAEKTTPEKSPEKTK